MDWNSWLGIALIAILVLCCVLPMIFMRHGRHSHGSADGRDQPRFPRVPMIVLATAGLLGAPAAAIDAPQKTRQPLHSTAPSFVMTRLGHFVDAGDGANRQSHSGTAFESQSRT